MVAVRRSDSRRSAGSLLRAKFWCVGKAGASSSRRRMSGRRSSALAWAPGLGRSPVRSSSASVICATHSPDAAVHARHRYGQLCPSRSGTGRGTSPRTPPLGTLHQFDHPCGTALWRRDKTIAETSPPDQHVRGVRGGYRLRSTAAARFATVATSLARRGEPIGTFDTLMAAHALSLGLTFVTNNTQHFGRVVGLKTENWV